MKIRFASLNVKFSRAWKKAHRNVTDTLTSGIFSVGKSSGKSLRENSRAIQKQNRKKPKTARNAMPRQTKQMRQNGE